MAIKKIEERLKIPEGVSVKIDKKTITANGPKGALERIITDPKVRAVVDRDEIVFIADKKPTKREKKTIGTLRAHVKNMLKGTKEGYAYKLKICSGHFPMNVSVSGNEFIVKNFIGEKTPRTLKIKAGVKIAVHGQEVSVEGIDKESVAQTSASIEQLTRRTNYDKRIFQDGIYITYKDHK